MPRPFCVVSDSCYNGSRIGSENEPIMKYSAFNTSGKREPERTECDLLLLALVSDTGSAGVQTNRRPAHLCSTPNVWPRATMKSKWTGTEHSSVCEPGAAPKRASMSTGGGGTRMCKKLKNFPVTV